MFCLPYPKDSEGVIAPIEIPYVANFEYDISTPGIFANFARERGFHSYNRPTDELASLMQSWLFFGLISEMVGRHVDHEVFVRSRHDGGNGDRFIDSRLDGQLDTLFSERLVSLRGKEKEHRNYVWSTMRERIAMADEKASEFEKVRISPGAVKPARL